MILYYSGVDSSYGESIDNWVFHFNVMLSFTKMNQGNVVRFFELLEQREERDEKETRI